MTKDEIYEQLMKENEELGEFIENGSCVLFLCHSAEMSAKGSATK